MAKKCFVIMPITTPEFALDKYENDKHHFEHVYDGLFKPAIEKAGLKPIPPKFKGSKLIHGEIIKNIEEADMVFCDISILNPNVFFELGIRTALNMPVCLVMDNKTEKIPFDTNMIHHHTYKSEMMDWIVRDEIPELIKHIEATIEECKEGNELWKHFSMSNIGQAAQPNGSTEEMFNYLIKKIDGLEQSTIKNSLIDPKQVQKGTEKMGMSVFKHDLMQVLDSMDLKLLGLMWSDNSPIIAISGESITNGKIEKIRELADSRGLEANVMW